METQKAHQIFYKLRDYDLQIKRYQRQEKTQYTNEELLVLAKAYFIDEEYEKCIELLKKIDPLQNTKVLFQRQSLLFRAVYLQKRREKPQAKDLAILNEIIAQFQRLKMKVSGQSFKKRHLQIMQGYKKFVVFLQKYSTSAITYSQKLFSEQEKEDKSTHKLSGFPCFLISQQWLEDYSRMKQQLELNSGKTYLGPITNFALINDIFQTHVYESEPQTYKNVYIFPINRYKIVSKKLWSFYTGVFSPQNQFCPIKRLFQERSYRQYHAGSSSEIVPLVPVLIQCEKNRTVFQLTGNELVQNELLPLVEQKYGTGELKNPYNQQNSFDFFYFGERSQKLLSDWGKILVYEKKKLPDHLKNFKIFNYLQYNPIPQTSIMNKEGGLKGLENLGNSCYLNSVIQCLSFTKQIAQHLTTRDITSVVMAKKEQGDGTVTLAFSDLLKQLWRATQNKSVSPHKFKKFFGIKNTMFAQRTQEDAHQFLLHLLNSIHQDLKRASVRVDRSLSKLQVTTNVQDVKRYFQKHQLQENKSIITQLLRGICHTTILCNNCNTTSHSFDLFLALSIPVPYVSYPSIKFYYVPWKGRMTYKYELSLKNVKTVNQLFHIFQREVIDVKADLKESKNNDLKLSEESSPDKIQTAKRNYVLLAFTRQSDPEQLWNYNSNNSLTRKQLQLEKVLQSKRQLIFYQTQILSEQMQLVLVQYKYKQMFSNEKAIGIPKFLALPEEFVKGKQANKFKKIIVDNNFQDRIYQTDLEEIKSYEWNKSVQTFKYSLTAYFRRVEKLFLDTNYIDKELNSASDAYDIRDCFKEMSKPDIIDGWKCGHCHHSKSAEKVEHITQTNQILIISLKRFQGNGIKIRNMINYPLENLDMKEWLEDKNGLGSHIYDLYGVCSHSGTMEYGHYRAYCKHFITGEWYEFDDERVKKIQASQVVTSQAYMLFYKRRDI